MLPCGLSKTNKNQTINNGASPRISPPSSRDHGELVASALTDGVRWQASLKRNADNTVDLAITKSNHTAIPNKITLNRDDEGFLSTDPAKKISTQVSY